MLVTKDEFDNVMRTLYRTKVLGLDTETTGLRPYHESRMFSLQLATPTECFYFNFKDYGGTPKNQIMGVEELRALRQFFETQNATYYIHNAKFDLAILAKEGIHLSGHVVDTLTLARLEFNDHIQYALEACAKRLGLEKSNQVELYIAEKKLYSWEDLPGRKNRVKNKHYEKVPLPIMQAYAELDAKLAWCLGTTYTNRLKEMDEESEKYGWPKIGSVLETETRLLKVLFQMEHVGVKVDLSFSKKAALFEEKRQLEASENFKKLTGCTFLDSAVVFKDVFKNEKMVLTEKGNPSFTSDVLKTFESPAAKEILEYRDAKSRANFYHTFIYEADAMGAIHPDFKPAGTDTGRFSCANPNLQNLTKEEGEDLKEEFVVRRAFIPRPEFFFFMPDYSQMEYRLMLDYGGNEELVKLILDGYDVHEATAQVSGLTRRKAKNANFAILYGAGIAKLALMLECSENEARAIREAVFRAAPGMKRFIRQAMKTAETRGFVYNTFGRRYFYPDTRFVYTAPNKIIQGGCADIMKRAMVSIGELLNDKKSRLVLNIHDEVVVEIHHTEAHLCEKIVKIMEETYPSRYLPLKVGAEYSFTSLADKIEGIPSESEIGNYFQKESRSVAS